MRDRFLAFITEQFPFATVEALKAFESVAKRASKATDAVEIDKLRKHFAKALRDEIDFPSGGDKLATTPGVTVKTRRGQSVDELVEACDGFLAREAIIASLSDDEKLEMLRGMLLTRALDTRLKMFFTG